MDNIIYVPFCLEFRKELENMICTIGIKCATQFLKENGFSDSVTKALIKNTLRKINKKAAK